MSRHEGDMSFWSGVSCDSCLKSNFRGRRYKCLICYDYDLCAPCYETGATTSHHITDHPMQCILTRSDFDLYYSGEALGLEQPQAYTCPFCNRMGFTDTSLQEHVTAEHSETQLEVVCPVCASMPGGEPNLVTDDFAGHLALEHRSGPRDLISFLDEPSAIRHGGVRRIPHGSVGRGVSRARRSNMHFSSSGGLNSLSPSSRDAVVDPIAELLSQLSGVRRSQAAAVAAAGAVGGVGGGTAASAQPAAPSQLQQLQMQLQLERQQVTAARQQLERLPRRQAAALAVAAAGQGGPARDAHHPHRANRDVAPSAPQDRRLLADCTARETPSVQEREASTVARAERGALLRGLLLASLAPPPPPLPAPLPAAAPPLPRRAAPPAPAAAPLATPAPRTDPRPLKAPPQQKLRAKGDQARTGPHLPDAR